jgi:hypothetical protein
VIEAFAPGWPGIPGRWTGSAKPASARPSAAKAACVKASRVCYGRWTFDELGQAAKAHHSSGSKAERRRN